MTDLADITKRLRALVIMDEAGSNNPLGRDAADTIERLQASVEAHSLALDERVAECADLKQKIFALNEQSSTLLRERDEARAKTANMLGVGDGTGRLFVYGDYDGIKAAQAYIFRAEAAEAEVVKLREALEFIDLNISKDNDAAKAKIRAALEAKHD